MSATTQQAQSGRQPGDAKGEAVHETDREWAYLRWQEVDNKMLFHPRPERPTEPNAGFVRYAPGSSHPMHRHDFAQVWYITEGDFIIGGKNYGPGTMIFHPDPHYEDELHTETGGVMLVVQYPGPNDLEARQQSADNRFSIVDVLRCRLSGERLDI